MPVGLLPAGAPVVKPCIVPAPAAPCVAAGRAGAPSRGAPPPSPPPRLQHIEERHAGSGQGAGLRQLACMLCRQGGGVCCLFRCRAASAPRPAHSGDHPPCCRRPPTLLPCRIKVPNEIPAGQQEGPKPGASGQKHQTQDLVRCSAPMAPARQAPPAPSALRPPLPPPALMNPEAVPRRVFLHPHPVLKLLPAGLRRKEIISKKKSTIKKLPSCLGRPKVLPANTGPACTPRVGTEEASAVEAHIAWVHIPPPPPPPTHTHTHRASSLAAGHHAQLLVVPRLLGLLQPLLDAAK